MNCNLVIFGKNILVAAFFLVVGLFNPVQGKQANACEMALVLAIDASSSVNPDEYELQMRGTAAALIQQDVMNAILSLDGVYLTAFEWNGERNQSTIFNWTNLRTPSDILAVSKQIVNHDRFSENSPTALGSALGFAHRLFPKLPQPCLRNVIDVSGDGESNHGIKPRNLFALYDFSNITVNGLAIVNPERRGKPYYEAIDDYYRAELLHGPGAFVLTADGFEDFERAMTLKLLSEFSPNPIGFLKNTTPSERTLQ